MIAIINFFMMWKCFLSHALVKSKTRRIQIWKWKRHLMGQFYFNMLLKSVQFSDVTRQIRINNSAMKLYRHLNDSFAKCGLYWQKILRHDSAKLASISENSEAIYKQKICTMQYIEFSYIGLCSRIQISNIFLLHF